jgi:hypothetical protein
MVSQTGKRKQMSLKAQLMMAIPELTERDFGTHETDLYVVAYASVCKWLKANYKFYGNLESFVGQAGSDWNGADKPCLAIPFENWADEMKARAKERRSFRTLITGTSTQTDYMT